MKTLRKPAFSEAIVTAYYQSQGLPKPVYDYVGAIPGRKFEIDIAFPSHKAGIEVQGGVHAGCPSHASASGIIRDNEKNNLLLLNGWRVLRVLPKDVTMLDTIKMIKQLIGGK